MLPTNEERRKVAERLRKSAKDAEEESFMTFQEVVAMNLSVDTKDNRAALLNYLADLIEPLHGFELDVVHDVCFECMEGADDPEWSLYQSIFDAISWYKAGEGYFGIYRHDNRPERTCHFEPDEVEVIFDEYGNEIETGEPAENCSAFECSECGYPMIFGSCDSWFEENPPYKPLFKYCPNCGAKVVE